MRALVTGGGGFLGSAIVRRLLQRGDVVRSFSRSRHAALDALGVHQAQGDLADADAVSAAAEGIDAVIHVAAKAGVWGPYAEYHQVNVVGTENVIAACRANNIRRLVYTSTPSVVYGDVGIEGGDESLPYPDRFLSAYPQTKAEAERAVLAANDDSLGTVSLRPHLIIGPGDNHLVPRIVERGRAGKLRRIGNRRNAVDWTWVDDGAWAHVLAATRLAPRAPISGKAYFISQGEPVGVWELVNRILQAAGAPPVEKRISTGTAYAAGSAFEVLYRLLGKRDEPPMTRFVAKQMSTPHWFDISAARRDLGYSPEVGIEVAMRRLAHWMRDTGL